MRSAPYEQMLQSFGVEFEYMESVPLDNINFTRSLRNQARLLTPIDEEAVSQYAQAYKDGCTSFPPLILWRPGKGQWIINDGNQRGQALLRLKRKDTDAYVIKSTDQKVIDELTWTWNNRINGRRISAEESMEHAVSYCRQYKVPVPEAAKRWGVKESQLESRVRLDRVKDTLRGHNVRITASITDGHLHALHTLLAVGEDVFCAAVQQVANNGHTVEEASDLARDVKRAPTVDLKLKKIQDFATSARAMERRAETKGGTIRTKPNGPREKYARLYKQLHQLQQDHGDKVLNPHSSEWKEFRQTVLEVNNRSIRQFGLGSLLKEDMAEVS